MALAAAPVVYMHPLEPYGLQSPQRFFEAATLFYQDRRNESETQYQFLTDLDPGDPLALMWGSRWAGVVGRRSRLGVGWGGEMGPPGAGGRVGAGALPVSRLAHLGSDAQCHTLGSPWQWRTVP